ncbi:MAG: hypothetical protein ACOY82_12660 [Pseudomonadota bacterium]
MLKLFGTTLLLIAAGAAAAGEKKPCETNYTQEGKFMTGRRFSTWDVVPGVSLATAFKRISSEGTKSGLQIASSDQKTGTISFMQQNGGQILGGGSVNLPWNVAIEAQGKDVKITVTKTTPGGYNTSADFQKESMCAVIDAARNP